MATKCPSVTYQLEAAEFEAVQAKLRGDGFDIHTDEGSYRDVIHNVTIAWDYDRVVGKLTITVVDKPYLLPCSVIIDKLNEGIKGTSV